MGAQSDPVVIRLQTYEDERGKLTVADGSILPFQPIRTFWLHDCDEPRGGHAHHRCWQAFICLQGRAEIITSGFSERYVWWLCERDEALIVPPGWKVDLTLKASLVLVLCSESYDKDDYIR